MGQEGLNDGVGWEGSTVWIINTKDLQECPHGNLLL